MVIIFPEENFGELQPFQQSLSNPVVFDSWLLSRHGKNCPTFSPSTTRKALCFCPMQKTPSHQVRSFFAVEGQQQVDYTLKIPCQFLENRI